MADSVIAASLTLDAGQAQKSMQDFKNEIKQAEKDYEILKNTVGETNAATLKAAENVSKLKEQFSLASESVKGFKTKVREAEENLIKIQQKFGATSKEALAAARGVAEMRDQMQEAKEVSDLFDPGAKFKVFGNVLRTVAGGFSAVTGTMAVFGAESEEVEKQLLKVQGALAITEGVNTIVDSAKDFDRLKAMIMQTTVVQKVFAASTTTAGAVTKALGVSTNTASTGFKLLRGAIIATGIGALVVAIGYLINNFDDVKKVIEKVIGPLKNITDFFGKLVNTVTDFVGVTSEAERALDRFTQATKRGNEDLETRIKILTAQGGKEAEVSKLRSQIAENDLNVLRKKLKTEGSLNEEDQKRFRELKEEKIILSIEEQNRLKKIADDADKKRLEDRKKDTEDLKQAREKAKQLRETRLKELEQKLKDEKEYQAEVQKMIEASTVAINQIDADKKQAEKDAFNNRVTNLQESFKNEASIYNELRYLQMDEIQQQETDELMRLAEWYNQRFEMIKGNAAAEAALIQSYETLKGKIEGDSLRQRIGIVGTLLGQMSNLFGKHTAAGKVTAIAEATINTYLAASKALTGIPKGNPIGAALAIAQAGVIIATGLKNVKEIVKVKVPGGGGSAPSIGSEAPAPLRPQLTQTSTILPQEQINQMGNIAAGGVNRSIRAHVVESDSQAAAAREQRLKGGGRLGG